MTYSLDFRRHILKIKAEEQLSYNEASLRFKISKSSLVRWNKELEPKKTRNKPATKINMEALKADVSTVTIMNEQSVLESDKTGIYWALKRLGVTYKKNIVSSKSRRREAIVVPE